ncbi:hypothetical protein JYK02_28860 [Corallococcus macrosporus]|uniref:Nuclear transport factor 2 family protein n=1 Tax=Corallococcus macrosporus TaxID=35 RepID=A0ABS3DJP5_9BACT|nr:hypothetical protein [Corallococcus macrosporus]MBN8231530.1 hypothetical protein [Corallococcus macrosporus]
MKTPITLEQIRRFASAWYQALDQHVPVEECFSLVAEDDLRMLFPDGDIRDFDSFKTWYERVTHLFFDENHNIQSLEATVRDDEAEVKIVVGWQASWFEPPAAKSKRVSLNATQGWLLRRSIRNVHGLEIVYYDATVEPFMYAPGFARL